MERIYSRPKVKITRDVPTGNKRAMESRRTGPDIALPLCLFVLKTQEKTYVAMAVGRA